MQNDDVNIKGVLIFLGVLVLTVVAFYAGLAVMWHGLEQKARRSDEQSARLTPAAAATARPYFPTPREQPAPLADLQALRASEEVELTSYGWVDKSNGVVRIPIDRAIELLTHSPEARP